MSFPHGRYAIIGLGQTGVSCARYLALRNESFFIVDSRKNPPGKKEILEAFPNVSLITGEINPEHLANAEYIVPGPGVPLDTPAVEQALLSGARLVSDIDLFCNEVNVPLVCVTGSNGKSTVTTLLGEMAKKAGVNAAIGGNIGIPVLDLLGSEQRDLYILELSSFQLERTHLLKPDIALFLNLSPDHLDVHHSFSAYKAAKHKIFEQCVMAVCHREEPDTWPSNENVPRYYFSSQQPAGKGQFGVVETQGISGVGKGEAVLLSEDEIKIKGSHNLVNVAAALTVGQLLDFPLSSMIDTIKNFNGLSHRCQWVAKRKDACWFNDSKGTNEAASVAAIEGLAFRGKKKLVLIAGGDGKEADFSQLAPVVNRHVRAVILIGKDALRIEKAIKGNTLVYKEKTLGKAVCRAAEIVQKGERVLLSPACTSLDMFENYQERGNVFMKLVNAIE